MTLHSHSRTTNNGSMRILAMHVITRCHPGLKTAEQRPHLVVTRALQCAGHDSG